MKKREFVGGMLMILAFILTAFISGGDEASYRFLAFLFSIAIFIAILGHEIGQFKIFSWRKKTASKILVANYFLIMLLALFPLPVVIQWINTVVALILLLRWTLPLIKKETGWGTQPVT